MIVGIELSIYLYAVMRRANALPDSFLVSYAPYLTVILQVALTS